MPRLRHNNGVRRIELRLPADDPMLEELAQEAERRGVELQQHIYDLLRGRYLLRRGESLATLLWLPGATTSSDVVEENGMPSAAVPNRTASAAASAWADLLGTGDA